MDIGHLLISCLRTRCAVVLHVQLQRMLGILWYFNSKLNVRFLLKLQCIPSVFQLLLHSCILPELKNASCLVPFHRRRQSMGPVHASHSTRPTLDHFLSPIVVRLCIPTGTLKNLVPDVSISFQRVILLQKSKRGHQDMFCLIRS